MKRVAIIGLTLIVTLGQVRADESEKLSTVEQARTVSFVFKCEQILGMKRPWKLTYPKTPAEHLSIVLAWINEDIEGVGSSTLGKQQKKEMENFRDSLEQLFATPSIISVTAETYADMLTLDLREIAKRGGVLMKRDSPTLASPTDFPPELVGYHGGAMGQLGYASEDGTLMFSEEDFTLGSLTFGSDGALKVWFPVKGEEGATLEFPFIERVIPGAMVDWKPVVIGEDQYSATLFRYGAVFRILVKLRHDDQFVSGVQWGCAEPCQTTP